MIPKMSESKSVTSRFLPVTFGVALLATTVSLHAQVITVPNSSFESQSGSGQPFGVNINIDSWQKAARPDYFPAGGYSGFFWVQTAGVFVDPNPYGNRDGTQAGYLLSFPQVALFQDYNTVAWNDASPSHNFNAIFEPGKSYSLTVGLFGKNMTEGSTLSLSLYYRDGLANMVTVGSTTVTYTAAGFPNTPPLSLFDYVVNVPTVQAGDAWAGQNIGIKIESTFGYGDGNWDFDNFRLQAVPEPTSLSLLALGLGGWLLRTRFPRRRV